MMCTILVIILLQNNNNKKLMLHTTTVQTENFMTTDLWIYAIRSKQSVTSLHDSIYFTDQIA